MILNNTVPTEQKTPTISVSSSGLITATAGDKTATQQLTTQRAQTITPGTSAKTIASQRYLTGTQTIAGDANLTSANIKSGVSIFGVNGSASYYQIFNVVPTSTSRLVIQLSNSTAPKYISCYSQECQDLYNDNITYGFVELLWIGSMSLKLWTTLSNGTATQHSQTTNLTVRSDNTIRIDCSNSFNMSYTYTVIAIF